MRGQLKELGVCTVRIHPHGAGTTTILWTISAAAACSACSRRTGCPFFEQLIADCLDRTETAMTQRTALEAARLAIAAQDAAGRVGLFYAYET